MHDLSVYTEHKAIFELPGTFDSDI